MSLMEQLSFDPTKSLVIIPVIFYGTNHKLRLRLAIDTGATQLMIPWETAEELGIHPEKLLVH